MSDFVIRQDGEPTNLSATRIATKVAEGSANWIPEQITNLARITINSNGEYLASNDGYYGYAIVNVCVAGGNEAEISGDPYVDPVTDPQTGEEYTPDHETEDFTGDFLDPELETPTKVTPPPNSKTGTESGKIMGIDPDTGEYVQVSIDQDGNIVTEAAKLPTKIRILNQPAKTDYHEGDKIQYAGLTVELLTEDDEVFKNDDFPWGYIVWQPAPDLLFDGNNLITPEEYVVAGSGAEASSATDPAYSEFFEQPVEYVRLQSGVYSYTDKNGDVYSVKVRVDRGDPYIALEPPSSSDSEGAYPIFISDESFQVKVYTGYTPEHVEENFDRWGRYEYADYSHENPVGFQPPSGKPYYVGIDYAGSIGWRGLPIEPIVPLVNTSTHGFLDRIALTVLYGDTIGGGRMECPVRWKSPYDGNTYETSFEITVSE